MKFLKKIVPISISFFFIYLCFKDISFKNLFANLNFNIWLLIYGVLLLFFINYLKAYRFKILLKNYSNKSIKFYLKLVLIRQFLNSTFFGKIGELSVPFMLKKNLNISYLEGIAIIITERIFDLSLISLIFGVTLFFFNYDFISQLAIYYYLFYFLLIFFIIFLIKYNIKLFFLSKKKSNKFIIYINRTIENSNTFIKLFLITFLIWSIFILIDFLLLKSFEVTNSISSLSNVIFLTCVIFLSQLIPSAPSSAGLLNFFVIKTIERFYEILNLDYNLQIQTELTSISIILLLIYIFPDITWGTYVFLKETSLNIKKLHSNSLLKFNIKLIRK